MDRTNCFFCNSQAESNIINATGNTKFHCDYCGKYIITQNFLEDYSDDAGFKKNIDIGKHIMAGFLEESKNNRLDSFFIGHSNYKEIFGNINYPKTTMQKLNTLLLYCYERNEFIGQEVALVKLYDVVFSINKDLYVLIGDKNRIGIAYTKGREELLGLFKAICEIGWINVKFDNTQEYMLYFYLTTQGLDFGEQLLTTNIDSNKVFIAMAFSCDYKEKCEEVIKPACTRCGFEAQKVDDEHYNGNIVDRIVMKIKRSKFVIADYTFDNSGAYYEAGYAEGMGLPVIECCEKTWFDKPDNKVHLDKRNNNLILYDDYKHLEEQIVERIRATIDGAIMEDH